jgi:hypothetical protein
VRKLAKYTRCGCRAGPLSRVRTAGFFSRVTGEGELCEVRRSSRRSARQPGAPRAQRAAVRSSIYPADNALCTFGDDTRAESVSWRPAGTGPSSARQRSIRSAELRGPIGVFA